MSWKDHLHRCTKLDHENSRFSFTKKSFTRFSISIIKIRGGELLTEKGDRKPLENEIYLSILCLSANRKSNTDLFLITRTDANYQIIW